MTQTIHKYEIHFIQLLLWTVLRPESRTLFIDVLLPPEDTHLGIN